MWLSAFWERGSPVLPACSLRRGSSGGPNASHLHQLKLKTLARSQASRGGRPEASSEAASSGRLARRLRDQGGGTSRGARDASHDDRDQAGARRAPACAVSLFPLWCKGGKHRPRHRAKVAIPVQQDQDQQSGSTEVTMEPKTASSPVLLAPKTTFGQDNLY